MHKEYAINPDHICQSWERFRFFWGQCGFSKGRLISKFPGKWKRKVFDSEGFKALSTITQQRVEFLLAKDGSRMVASQRQFDKSTGDWLSAAINAHQSNPFHALINEDNPDSHKDVLLFDAVDEETDLWKADTSMQVRRTSENLGQCTTRLLSACREVKIIDPYFSFKPEFTGPFKEFLTHLVPYASRLGCLEVHFKFSQYARDLDWAAFQERFQSDIVRKKRHYLPKDGEPLFDKLVFHAWEDSDAETLHARCVVTELGGIQFERGLSSAGQTEAMTIISLMSDADTESYRKRYSEIGSPFIHKASFRASEISA